MEPEDDLAIEGNAVAGSPANIFAVDVTGAEVTCAACGTSSPLAEEKADLRGPESSIRCKHCSSVLGRFRRAQDAIWVDLDTSAAWQVALPH
jgi:DNA-directed RNA polymerase subunit RPC12/RpoP